MGKDISKLDKKRMIHTVVMFFLPLIICVVYCLINKCSLFSLDITNSFWDDELIYFKQVQGVLKYGIPQGFFGYDESRAAYMSFSTWGPTILIPWVIMGRVIGWNYFSPVLCNLIFASFIFAISIWLINPKTKNLVFFALLCCSFLPLYRFILSGMPEIYLYGCGILVIALCLAYYRENKAKYLYISAILIPLITLFRPYMLAFVLLPLGLAIRKRNIKGIILSTASILLALLLFWVQNKFLCAKYFGNAVQLEWIKSLKSGSLEYMYYAIGGQLKRGIIDFVDTMLEGLFTRLPRGVFCLTFIAQMLLIIGNLIVGIVRKKEKNVLFYAVYLLMDFSILMAVIMIYPELQAAAKHLTVFTLGSFLLLAELEELKWEKYLLVPFTVFMIYAFNINGSNFPLYNYDLEIKTEEHTQAMTEWKQILQNKIEIKGGGPSYDNSIIYVFPSQIKWDYLYALPAGIGIQFCNPGYVKYNFEHLKCRYLYIEEDGEFDKLCQEKQKTELIRMDGIVVYDLKE